MHQKPCCINLPYSDIVFHDAQLLPLGKIFGSLLALHQMSSHAMWTNSGRVNIACSVKAGVMCEHSRVSSSCLCAAAKHRHALQWDGVWQAASVNAELMQDYMLCGSKHA